MSQLVSQPLLHLLLKSYSEALEKEDDRLPSELRSQL